MELLYIILVVLAVTRFAGEVAERLKQPALLGEIFGGIALGAIIHQFSNIFPKLLELTGSAAFTAIVDLGIFFLMLLAGIELKPRRLAAASRKAALIALGGFVLPLLTGFALAWEFLPDSELKMVQSLFVGTALAITAIPVALRVLMDLGHLDTVVGNQIVAAALLDDVFSLVLLAVLLTVISSGTMPSLPDIFMMIFSICAFFATTIVIGRFVIPRIGRVLLKTRSAEFEFSAVLLYGLGSSYLAEAMGLHFILGAFMAGVFFNRTTVNETVYNDTKTKLSGITRGFLAPIFFASIGMNLEMRALYEVPLFVGLLVAVAVLGKLLGAGLPALWLGASRLEALAIGVAMSARGAVELVIANIALRGGIFSAPVPPPPIVANLFSAVVIVAVVTTLAMPLLLRPIMTRLVDREQFEE